MYGPITERLISLENSKEEQINDQTTDPQANASVILLRNEIFHPSAVSGVNVAATSPVSFFTRLDISAYTTTLRKRQSRKPTEQLLVMYSGFTWP